MLVDSYFTMIHKALTTGSQFEHNGFTHPIMDILIGVAAGVIFYYFGEAILDKFNINLNLDDGFTLYPSLSAPSLDKKRAMHPKPDKRLLIDEIDGKSFIFGKYKDKYVGIKLDSHDIRNITLIGAPGVGKSVSLITNLIAFQQNNTAVTFGFDVKPELASKSNYIDASNVRYVDPTSMIGCGWNVYYELGEDPSTAEIDKIINTLDTISRALIQQESKDNLIFSESARNIFIGACAYGIRRKRGFIDCLTAILQTPLQDLIAEIMLDKDIDPEIKSYVNAYQNDNETTQSINVTLRQSLNLFQNKNVFYKLQNCLVMASPLDLLNDINVYIAIPDYELKEYSPILRLIATQVMNELGKTSDIERSKPGTKPIILLLDEFGSIGKIPNIFDALARFRSRQIMVITAYQCLHQVALTYSKEEANMLWDLSKVKLVLSNTDDETANKISNLAGKYRESKTSLSTRGEMIFKDKSNTYSEEYRPILEGNDLLTIEDKKEIVVFTKEGYNRVKRADYFLIDGLKEWSEDCKKHNEKLIEAQTGEQR